MTNNAPVKQALIEAFGKKAYQPDGSLNRVYLAQQAFEEGRVKELNAIVHPHIPQEVALLMKSAEDRGFDVAVYEAALLLQNLRPDNLDYIVLVLADEGRRTRWVRKRDGAKREQVLDRIDKQQDFEELTHLADIVIKNDGTLEELKEKARNVYQQFMG